MKGNIIAYRGKNKLGDQVGYVRGGVQMFRHVPLQVRNPKTTKQQAARKKLTAISRMGAGMSYAIKLGYKAYDDTRVSARNLFFTDNYRRVNVNPTTLALTINYDEVQISKGRLPGATFGTLDFSTSGKVILPITDGGLTLPDAKSTDKMVVAVYTEAFEAAAMNDLSQDRQAAEVQIEVPAMWQGCEVHVYAFVLRDDSADYQASMTYYCGSGTLS